MFLFRNLRSIDAAFARQADATSYRALLREMQAAEAYTGTPYAILQKRASRMWSALKRYRAEQRAVRTRVPTYVRRLAAEPMAIPDPVPQANDSGKGWGAAQRQRIAPPSWPAAHAGCVMQ
jgi:hypothetical protein